MSKQKTQARRDKARQRQQADRALINLSKERYRLDKMIREAPLVELEEPYQRGWIRYFILTDEALRRKDAERFQALLEYLQNIQHAKHRHFMIQNHQKSRRLRPIKHRLGFLSVSMTIRLKIPDELLSYLVTHKRRPIYTRARLNELMLSRYSGQIKVRHPHYFEPKVEPYMITHSRVALPEVESRLAEVEAILYQPQNSGRLTNLQCSRVPSWKYLSGRRHDAQDKREALKEAKLGLLEYMMDKQSITQEGVVTPPFLFLFKLQFYLFRLTRI
ncbi:MAG: hypothetical protein ACSHX0_00085 [Akkermansiaceae bacterium]